MVIFALTAVGADLCWSILHFPRCIKQSPRFAVKVTVQSAWRRELKPKHLVCLGGFKNLRQDYNYEGLKMELDETSYEWGTCYEIEIETVSHRVHILMHLL